MAIKAKQIGFKQMKCDFNYKNISEDMIKEYRINANNNENYVLFKIFEDMINERQFSTEYDFSKDVINVVQNNELLIRSLVDIVSENLVPIKELNVLEINLSNNFMVKDIDRYLNSYSLTPTDIKYKLFVKSMEGLEDNFKANASLWNVKENDIALYPSHLIVLRDTLDLWTIKTEEFIQDINDCIIGNGFLLSVFKYKFTEPEIALNSLNGKKVFNDSDLELRIDQFISIANKVGFNLICRKLDSISTMALLFKKVTKLAVIPTTEQIIQINTKYEEWFELLREKLLEAKEREVNKCENIWLIANDSSINGIIGLMNCLRLEPGGENLRCIFIYDKSIDQKIDFNSKPFNEILINDLVINVMKDGKLGTYRHLKLPKDYDKCLSNEYFLNLSQNRDLSSLQWLDSKNIVPNNKEVFDLNNNQIKQIQINIYSSGLTFHDIIVDTGLQKILD